MDFGLPESVVPLAVSVGARRFDHPLRLSAHDHDDFLSIG
jgi:hypothetical protein